MYTIWIPVTLYVFFIYYRCGPCQRIAPIFETFPAKYPKAIFLKVDVDKCQDTAAGQGVSAMPTFIFYRNKSKLDRVQGANIEALESKIQQLIGSDDGDDGEEYGQGLVYHHHTMLVNSTVSLIACGICIFPRWI